MEHSKLNDKNYLKQLSQDKERLDEEINLTHGYVLYAMEKQGIFPKLEDLLEKQNILSMNFILKHYDLDKSQLRNLQKYFNTSGKNKVAQLEINKEETIDYLKNGWQLPSSVILSQEVLANYMQEIDKQFELDEYNTEKIIENSLHKISVDDFLNFDKEYLIKNSYLFLLKKSGFKDKRFNALYKEVMLTESERNPKNKIDLHDFRYYHFSLEEKDFLMSLLKASSSSYRYTNYENLESIPGLSDIITPLEFFTEYNTKNIKKFSLQELEDNKDTIQSAILNNFKNAPRRFHISFIDSLVDLNSSLEQFKTIVTPEFIKEMVLADTSSTVYLSNSRDSYEAKERMEVIEYLLLEAVSQHKDNKEFLEKIDADDILKLVNKKFKEIRNPFKNTQEEMNEFYKTVSDIYLEVFPQQMTTETFGKIMHWESNPRFKSEYSIYINGLTQELIPELALKVPTINMFAVLLSHYSLFHTSLSEESRISAYSTIVDLAKKLNKEDVKDLCNYYDVKLPKLTLLKNSSSPQNPEENFLSYKDSKLEDFSMFHINKLYYMKPNFKKYIVENKIYLGNEYINILVYQATKEEAGLKHLKKYIEVFKDQILDDHQEAIKSILKLSNGKSLLNLDNAEYEKQKFSQFLKNFDETNAIQNEMLLLRKTKADYQSDNSAPVFTKEMQERLEKLNNEEHTRHTETREILSELSYEFILEKLDSAVNNKNYALVAYLNKTANKIDLEKFASHVNQLSFSELVQALEDNDFKKLIEQCADRDNKYKIQFKDFSDRENMMVFQLVEQFMTGPQKICSLFKEENLNFVKDILVNQKQLDMFYNFYYTPRLKTYDKNDIDIISKSYSNEEVYKAYKKLEKKSNIFGYGNDSDDINRFFHGNYAGREEQFLELVKKAEADDIKLYLLLSDSYIITDYARELIKKAPEGSVEKGYNLDKATAIYFNQHFNVDKIIEGIAYIIDEMKLYEKEHKDIKGPVVYNHLLAQKAIVKAIHNFNYETDRIHYANITDLQSEKVIKLLLNNAPALLFNFQRIGTKLDLNTYLKENVADILSDQNFDVEKILYLDERFVPGYFAVDAHSETYQNEYVNSLLTGLLSYYSQKNDADNINYMSYLIQQYKFIQEEVNYEYKDGNFFPKGNTQIVEYLGELSNDHYLSKLLTSTTHRFFLENALSVKSVDEPVKRSRKI